MPGTCPRCSKQVYFAEEIKAKEEVFHKLCFNCSSCKKLLGPGNFSENDGNIYCKTCYGKNFGPRGYGFGGGAGVLSMDAGAGPGGRSQQRSSSDQPPASAPSPGQAAQEAEGGMKPRWGGGNTCPKCDKTVYFAEQIKAAFHTWHRACFTCSTCDKRLDAATCCDSRDRVYCRPCYGRNFGPKGVGYGLGAGTLQTN